MRTTRILVHFKMKKMIVLLILGCAISAKANGNLPLSIQEPTSDNEFQYAVKMIQRICPTVIWDSWVFRQIWFDEEDQSIVMAIQPHNYDGPATQADIENETEIVLKNFAEAYSMIPKEHSVLVDGDFMLYMSVGTLLHCLSESKSDIGLRIIFLKPDNQCLINPEEPQRIANTKLRQMIQ